MRAAFVISDEVLGYDYGPHHPLKVVRLKLTRDLIQAYGLLDWDGVSVVPAPPASREDLLRFHTEPYVEVLSAANLGRAFPGLEAYGIGPGDNPVFPGM